MKFNRILEQYVKESEALTKIMLKVDPANSVNKDYRDLDGYEGYILKENNNKWSILFENIDIPIMDVPFSIIKVVDVPCDETFNNIKTLGLKAIEEKKGLTMEIMNKIQMCNNIDFLEQYLKEEGLSDSEIKDVYKKALLGDTISEGALGTAGKIARGVGKFLGAVSQPDQAFAGLIRKGVEAVEDKKNKIIGNIEKAWKGDETDDTESQTNTPQANKPPGNIIAYAPPRKISSKVDSVNPESYKRDSHILNYINSGSIPKNNYEFYINKTDNSRYLYNTKTNDIIKITPTTDPRAFNIRVGNLYSAAPDENKVKNYFDNVLPTDIATNNVRFHNTSLLNII